MTRRGIIHFMFHPVSAKRFAEPLVASAIADGLESELWIEALPGLDKFRNSIKVPTQICSSSLDFNPVKALKTFLALLKRLRERNPLVVHAHLFRGAFLPLLAAKFSGVPVRIYHNHGVSYLGYQGAMRYVLMMIETGNCLLATHVITVNPALRPALQKVNPARHPITVFGPGSVCGLAPEEYAASLDPQRKIAARQGLGLKDKDLVLLYVGRPHKHKGFEILLKGFVAAFATRSDVQLVICGCDQNDVQKIIPHPPPNIRALGYHENLRPMYEASDAILLPSLYEGLPYSLLEAAAQGCALLASKIPGAETLVEEGRDGFLVTPGDLGDLIRVLHHMDQERGHLPAMGEAAYQKAQAFRREKIIAPYLSFMRNIISESKRF